MKTQIDNISNILASEMGAFADILTAAAGDNAQLLGRFYEAWEKVEAAVDGDIFDTWEKSEVML